VWHLPHMGTMWDIDPLTDPWLGSEFSSRRRAVKAQSRTILGMEPHVRPPSETPNLGVSCYSSSADSRASSWGRRDVRGGGSAAGPAD
jgi:hypothetical protein